jgi:hypothetical protein
MRIIASCVPSALWHLWLKLERTDNENGLRLLQSVVVYWYMPCIEGMCWYCTNYQLSSKLKTAIGFHWVEALNQCGLPEMEVEMMGILAVGNRMNSETYSITNVLIVGLKFGSWSCSLYTFG